MFNGNIPIILDSLKQHYFIDRDGKLFRHVLNFMRTGRLSLPDRFSETDALLDEAQYYDIAPMIRSLDELVGKQEVTQAGGRPIKREPGSPVPLSGNHHEGQTSPITDCVVLNISPDLGERISLLADRALLEELFPELSSALMDTGWNVDTSNCHAVSPKWLLQTQLTTGDAEAFKTQLQDSSI